MGTWGNAVEWMMAAGVSSSGWGEFVVVWRLPGFTHGPYRGKRNGYS